LTQNWQKDFLLNDLEILKKYYLHAFRKTFIIFFTPVSSLSWTPLKRYLSKRGMNPKEVEGYEAQTTEKQLSAMTN
jgi:hypothetical protein